MGRSGRLLLWLGAAGKCLRAIRQPSDQRRLFRLGCGGRRRPGPSGLQPSRTLAAKALGRVLAQCSTCLHPRIPITHLGQEGRTGPGVSATPGVGTKPSRRKDAGPGGLSSVRPSSHSPGRALPRRNLQSCQPASCRAWAARVGLGPASRRWCSWLGGVKGVAARGKGWL